MARLRAFRKVPRERHRIHEATECEYAIYEIDGEKFLQLDTVGSTGRKLQGKVSQSIQIDGRAAKRLWDILRSEFAFPVDE
jgi:hypothetical protein